MHFHEFKAGQVVQFAQKDQKVIRGLVTAKGYLNLHIMWAVSEWPIPIEYTIENVELLEKMTFYANWHEYNTVPVKTINTLNHF